MDVRVVLELSPPGMQDAGETRQVSPDKACLFGEAFDGLRGRCEQGRIGALVMRADEGSEGCGDGEGDEEVGAGKLLFKVAMEPLLSCMVLALRAVAVTAGVVDAVFPATALALRETVSVLSALALLDGAQGLAV